MIASIEIPPDSLATIGRHQDASRNAHDALCGALEASAYVGAETVREGLVVNSSQYDLVIRNQASGLVASILGWMIDRSMYLAAVGVPSNAPASRYADILERGGRIVPKSAKALAIPVSAEAHRYSSPRQMPNLTMIPRKGRPPLLVQTITAKGNEKGSWIIHWVLLSSVTIRARRWFSSESQKAVPAMQQAFGDRLADYARTWAKGGV